MTALTPEQKNLVQQSSIWAGLAPDQVNGLVAQGNLREFSFGQYAAQSGDSCQTVSLVLTGTMRLVCKASNGTEATLDLAKSGAFWSGSLSEFSEPLPFSVRAATAAQVFELPLDTLTSFFSQSPALRAQLTERYSRLQGLSRLRRAPVLNELNPEALNNLLQAAQPERLPAGQRFSFQGGATGSLFLIETGTGFLTGMNGTASFQVMPGGLYETAVTQGTTVTPVYLTAESDVTFLVLDRTKIPATTESHSSAQVTQFLERKAIHPRLESEVATLAAENVTVWNGWFRRNRIPLVRQINEKDCGAASLTSVLRHYGKSVTQTYVREQLGIGREGITLFHLARGAEKLGFETRSVKGTLDLIAGTRLPAILHWEQNHYVVLYRVAGSRVTLMDPAKGIRQLDREAVHKGWDGLALLLTPTDRLADSQPHANLLRPFLKIIFSDGQMFREVLLVSAALQILALGGPVFMQLVIDRALVLRSPSLLTLIVTGMILVATFEIVFAQLRQFLFTAAAQRIDLRLMTSFYRHVLHLPYRFFEDRTVGDIIKRFSDNTLIRDLFTGKVIDLTLGLVTAVSYLFLMVAYSPGLTVVALATIPIQIGMVLLLTPWLRERYREQFKKDATSQSFLVETITGIRTVKGLAIEAPCAWRFEDVLLESTRNRFRTMEISVSVGIFSQTLFRLNSIILLYLAAQAVLAGKMSIGQMIAFQTLANGVVAPILGLVGFWTSIQEVKVALERLAEVYQTKSEIGPGAGQFQLPEIKGRIEFQNVSFAYPSREERKVLKNTSLVIQPGQVVGIVGRSGSGKTTLINLIMRFYEPTEGKIMLDGQDISYLDLDELRRSIGFVSQETFLFDRSIRDNICVADPDLPLSEAVLAAQIAGAHDFISELPYGYETRLGEGSHTISGGQRQRIAIARALAGAPRLLIFDEATSALDTETERAVQERLRSSFGSRTTLIVTHRLATVREADRILVVDSGEIVEDGTHEELLEARGLYHYLWRNQ
ncbi:MAG: ATP-binding cassette domain-containing protein [Blastocatellia bacterium]|nr:ATP-binding cassette domain-containing protein [Blastocatellia bacterium]